MQNRYTIEYQGFKLGEHHLSFPFGDDLFDGCDASPITHGNGTVEIDALKHASMMELRVEIRGAVELECDRCADEYMQDVEFEGVVVVKNSERADELKEEQDGDIIWVFPNTEHIDLKEWIYESVILSLPLQRVHRSLEECNEEILKYIKQ